MITEVIAGSNDSYFFFVHFFATSLGVFGRSLVRGQAKASIAFLIPWIHRRWKRFYLSFEIPSKRKRATAWHRGGDFRTFLQKPRGR